MSDFLIVNATVSNGGIDFIFNNAKREGWEPGLMDLNSFILIDPNGFFIAMKGVEIIGCVSGIRYDETYGFIGYYIVIPEQRGRGYGMLLFMHAMRYLGTRNIGLDGVLQQVGNYAKVGFKTCHLTARYQGASTIEMSTVDHSCLVPLSYLPFSDLTEYDRRHFPASRDPWIKSWLDGSIENLYSAAFVNNGVIEGYGVLCPSVTGYRVGPLFADTPAIAKQLLNWLLSQIAVGTLYYLDIPLGHRNGIEILQNATHMFNTQRMYTSGETVNVCWGKVYACSSLEFG